MGRGNFVPSDMYLADCTGYYIETSCDEWEDLIDVIQYEMKSKFPSFCSVSNKWDHNAKVILENSIAQIIIADNEWSHAVYIVVPDTEAFPHKNLGLSKLITYGDYLKKILLLYYPDNVYVRTGPWTSGKVAA